jgi:type VI secretion system secreted protein VgrG
MLTDAAAALPISLGLPASNEATRALFTLAAGPFAPGRLKVLSIRGREATSLPFRFDLTLEVDQADAPELEQRLLGQPATLALDVAGGEPRNVCGIIAALEARDVFLQGRHVFRARLVPRLWLLGKRKTSRIFQDKTVPEIVGEVLRRAGVPLRPALVAKYAPRTYCVQYQETDLAFTTRLLAEEGIFYSFEHASEETVVLGDSPHLYQPIAGDPELAYAYQDDGNGLMPREHHVTRFASKRSLRSGTVLQRDYDFRRPLLDLRAEAKPSSSTPPPVLAAEDTLSFEVAQLGVYDHHGVDEHPDVDSDTARVRLEQHRRHARVAKGTSACRRLLPGLRFELVDHTIDALNGSYVIARVEHDGHAPDAARGRGQMYTNAFECVPADVALRPVRPTRTLQQVTETALVVGPEGEEIYTDEHGRVKVQFPWDLDGKRNEQSSCWVRVSQVWAGQGWGFQFVPRIGMEVVVTFVGGDVDRPLITGCVPNALNVPPFNLPDQRTRSGVVTRTTPGGGGRNELSFEDQKGAEEVRLHAQRDLNESIGNDHATVTGRNRDTTTGGHHKESVSGHRTVRAGGDQAVTVGGDRREETGGNASETIAANKTVAVRGDLRTDVAGRVMSSFGGAGSVQAGGGLMAFAGAEDKPSSIGVYAHGVQRLGAKDAVELVSDNKIVLQVGQSRIELTPERITLSAKEIVLLGGTSTSLFGNGLQGPALHLTDDAEMVAPRLRLHAKNASLALEDNADIRGKLVRLNCKDDAPDAKGDKDEGEETKPFRVNLHDADFNPYAGKKYRLLAGGQTREGTAGADGAVAEQVPKSATAVQVTVWIDTWPTGRRLSWTISLAETLPPVGSLPGAMERLRNLGYGPGTNENDVDATTRRALVAFQSDHDLPETGALDAATIAKLEDRHGH